MSRGCSLIAHRMSAIAHGMVSWRLMIVDDGADGQEG